MRASSAMSDTYRAAYSVAGIGFAWMCCVAALSGCGRIDYDPLQQRDGGNDLGQDSAADAPESDASERDPLIVVTPTSGLTTSESGASDLFTVRLSKQPTAAVTVGLRSSDVNEGTLSRLSLTFTLLNWNAPQVVTVTGHDDDIADGPNTYTIVTDAASSSDVEFGGFDPDDVSVTNLDDELAAVVVDPVTGLRTSEAGMTATFTVALNRAPVADVSLSFASATPAEAAVAPSSIVFTPSNYASPQTITVTGVNDSDLDGEQPFGIATSVTTSADPDFDGLEVADVSGTNLDDEQAALVLTGPTSATTTEAGGFVTFAVALQTAPSETVTVAIASDDPGEGIATPAMLTFTPSDWNTPKAVSVTGIDDVVADGDQPYSILLGPSVSIDTHYNGTASASVPLLNQDDDSPNVLASPAGGLVTTEIGGTDTFVVTLATAPVSNVVIAVNSTDTSEGTASPAFITFTTLNWNTPRTVVVTGVNDGSIDGPQSYQVMLHVNPGADPAYLALSDVGIDATNLDDETPGIEVAPHLGLTTTEAGGADTFTLVLNAMPSADVTVAVSSSDATEGAVSPATLTFTSSDWSVAQTVTVTGVDDFDDDGNIFYTLVTAPAVSADLHYNGLNASDVTATNLDNEIPSISVTPTSGLSTTESGGTATFTVVLTSRPTADVAVAFSSSNINEGTVAPASLTFTMADWSTPQTVTVTGVADTYIDGNQSYTIVTAPAASADSTYNTLNAADVFVTNIEPACNSLRFDPAVDFATGMTPIGVVTGDLNNDGNVDLVVSSNAGDVSVFLGTGTGAFGASTTYAMTSSLNSAALGDFNRDGLLDLAVDGSLSMFVRLNVGAGVFGAATTYPITAGGRGVTSADLNNDGYLDLISIRGAAVNVLLGAAGGTFGAAVAYATVAGGFDVDTVDWNHDGRLDIVTANSTNNTFSLLLNTGSGTFGAATTIASDVLHPLGLAVAEVTGDAWPEVIAGAETSDPNVVTLFANQTGVFVTTKAFSSAGGVVRNLATADFDRDGNTDIAVSHETNQVSVSLGSGNGEFGSPVFYNAGTNTQGIAAADFNNDGHVDIVTTNATSNTFSILLGRGGIGSDGSFRSGVSTFVGSDPEALDRGDINQDGADDVATAHPGGAFVKVISGGSTGTLGGTTMSWSTTGDTAWSMRLADFNQDGFLDMASTQLIGDTVRVSLSAADYSYNFLAPTNYSVGMDPYDVTSGDFNRDGRADLATANINGHSFGVLLNSGGGLFAPAVNYAMGVNAPRSVVAGDINNDGALDIALASATIGLSVALGTGTGTFGAATSFATGAQSYGIALADFNRDGRLDVAITNSSTDTMAIMLGNGLGSFVLAGSYGTGDDPRSVATDDFNRDGRIDAVVANAFSGSASLYLGNGDGTMTPGDAFATGTGTLEVVVHDFNHDGHPDFRAVNATSQTVSTHLANRICLP